MKSLTSEAKFWLDPVSRVSRPLSVVLQCPCPK
jgi:hypothetical protein